MNTKRYNHACLVDKITSSIHVMGGYNGNRRVDSTEIWKYGADSWQRSAKLPEAIDGSSAVSSNSNQYVAYMVGGDTRQVSSKVWGLRREDMTWREMSQTLKTGRYYHRLLNIPEDKVFKC